MAETWLLVLLGAVAAGFVQGLSGFGFGMVAMSFWAWVLEPRLAAMLAVFGALTGQMVAAFSVRRGAALKTLVPFILGGLIGIPLGIRLLPQLDMNWFRLLLGLLLAVWCPTMLWAGMRRDANGQAAHLRPRRCTICMRIANGIVGVAGGAMGALGGFTGVIPTLWCTLCGYERDVQRTVIQNFNLAMLLVTAGTYLALGIVTQPMWSWLALVLPAVLIPSFIGTRIYIGISEQRFRQILLGLLTLSGCAMLTTALPRILAS